MKKVIITLAIIFAGTFVFAAESVFTLDNGQTVVIKEVRTNPIVTMDTWIRTGSINEDDTNNGVAHFLEHLFFKGSKNHAPGEFDKLLESKGATTNAATSKDFTHYYITIPSKDFEEALALHADMLLNPLIPRKELEKERKVVLEEISKDENSPNHVVYDNLVSLLYTNHPYKRKVIGQKNIIETIHRDEILNFYNTWYTPSNMVTVIAGDVDTEKALELIKKNFSGNETKAPTVKYPKEKQLTEQARKVAYLPSESAYMLIGFRSVDINKHDAYALDVLAAILADGRSSIFYQEIKDKLQLAYSISAVNSTSKDDGIFYISANFTPDKLQKLEATIFEEINKIKKDGVTPEQVSLAKNIIERDTYYQRESISNIAQEIGYIMVTSDNNIKIYDDYVENIKKVTPADVKRVANKYLGIEKSAVSIVLPESAKEVEVSNVTAAPSDAKLISENKTTGKYELSNGATLLLTPNTSNEIIAINIFAKGGNFLQSKYGVSALTASTMLKGTKKYSPVELAQILEDNGIKIVPSVRSDAFSVTVLTTKNEYEKTLSLLNEIINNATFSNYEIEKVKNETVNNIKKSRDIPLQVAIEEYKNLIFENSPYTNSTKQFEKNIPAISREEILAFYNRIFNPQNITISINGNVDKDLTVKAFSTMFKSTDTEKFSLTEHKSEITPVTSARTCTKIDSDTNTDWVFLGWQVAGSDSKKDYATLQVIDSLLGSGMSSRLFKNLRDQEGLAYQLGSSYSANALKGAFLVYIGTNHATLEKAQQMLMAEIQKLKTEFVGTKELREAKDKLLGQFILSQETNLDKAYTIGWFETVGLGYDFPADYGELINSVTEGDIIEVANKYFNSNYVLSIVKK